MTVLDIDGPDWADFLRYRMNDKVHERMATEQSWLLTSRERFADLMVGNTEFKRESDENAKARMERRVMEAREEERRARKHKNKLRIPKMIKDPLGKFF